MDETNRDTASLSDADVVASNYEGFIDAIEDGRIFGWAFDPEDKDSALAVEIFHGRSRLGRVVADRYRADLVHYGHNRGRNAFVFNLPKAYWAEDPSTFHACFEGSNVPLLRGPRCSRLSPVDGSMTADSQTQSGQETSAATLDALLGRVEACERAIVSVVHLAHPGSPHQKEKAAEQATIYAKIENLRDDLSVLEEFFARNDRDIKEIKTLISANKKSKRRQILGKRINSGQLAPYNSFQLSYFF